MAENWDLQLVIKMESDEEQGIVELLEEIARSIKNGKYSGEENYCSGVYRWALVEGGIIPDDVLRGWFDLVQ